MLSYPLDDTYIHMAIAKNIAKYGVWGVTRFQFSAASSSILYSLLLSSLFFTFGVNVWIPLIINWIAAGCILLFITNWAGNYLSTRWNFIFSILFIFLVPLPSLVVTGMEHTFHVLFCLIFLYITYEKLSGDKISNWLYFLIAVLVVSARYEGIFLAGITAIIWLLTKRDLKVFFMLTLGILIPVGLFGTYSIFHGGFFLPNSLLVKGPNASGSIVQFIGTTLTKIYDTGLIYSLLFIPCLYFFLFPLNKNKPFRNSPLHVVFIIVVGTCLLHFLLARFGKPYRYGAYLIAIELMWIPAIWKDVFTYVKRRSFLSFAFLLAFTGFFMLPVLFRIGISFKNNISMKNIHDQQVTMALFVHKYFPKTTVALNDIGAVAFYNDDVHIFDLVGLANIDVLKYHKNKDSAFLRNYMGKDQVKMALVYPGWIEWLGYKKPSNWELLGNWYLTDNYVAGNSRVGIFATDSTVRDTLINALKAYSSELPSNVKQSGLYIDQMRE